jgi:TPR repeat protein
VWTTVRAIASWVWYGAPAPLPDPGPRAPVVVGYSNALWRLGWRYEFGRGAPRNVPEAMRCYRKSAGLGNVEAQARVAPQPVVAIPVAAADDEPTLDVTA